MSLDELFQDLDPKIAGPLQRITEALRAEIGSQIDGVRQDVQSLVGDRPAPPPATDELDPLEELKHATANIDRATKQASILTALLEGAGRFSSRSAFILIRDDGQRCWDSLGFDDAGRDMRGASVEVSNGNSVWSRIGDGAGSCGLSAEECAIFCSQFEASTPDLGALLPLSLGDHVAGYLYADRVGGDALNITALQLLTFVAGQTLETLPVRGRSSTPTLIVADIVAAPAVAPAAEPPAPESEPEPEATMAAEAAGLEAEAAPVQPLETVPLGVVTDEAEVEAPAAEPEVAEPEFVEPEPEPEPVETEAEAPAIEEPVAPEPDVGEAGVEPEAEVALYEAEAPAVEAPEEPEYVPPVEETVQEAVAPPESPTTEIPPVSTEEVTEVAVDDAGITEEMPAAPQVPEPPAAPTDVGSTQVVPPDDVLGPGWAFTAKEGTEETGNEALREEARRLARLLVTEIKLYNEEQVDQGRRSGDIYRRLQEDIDRSRQIFEDRIDEQIRQDNDYFREALVRILAGGDESLLGT